MYEIYGSRVLGHFRTWKLYRAGGKELSGTQIKRHKKATRMKKGVFFSQSSLYCKRDFDILPSVKKERNRK